MWRKYKFFVNEFRSRKVFRAWLYSYLLLLVVSIIAGLLLCSIAFRYIRQEADRSQYQSMERMTDSLDAAIDSVAETALTVANNRKLISLKKRETYTIREYSLMWELNTELSRLETANKYIDTIWISFNRSGYLLSESLWYQPDWCEKGLLSKMGFTLGQWREVTSGQRDNGFYINQSKEGTCLYYLFSWSDRKEDSPEASILVYFKNVNIQKLTAWTDSQTWIVGEKGGCFSAENQTLEEAVLQFVAGSERPYEIMKSKNSYIKKLTSERYGYTLVHIVSKAGYLKMVNRFWFFVGGYLAISILVGGSIAIYLTRHHYSAVERLLAAAHKSRTQKPERNEFQVIETAIRQLEQRNQKLNQNQDKKEAALKSIQMSALLKGWKRLAETGAEVYGSVGSLSEAGRYLLVGFELEQEPEEEEKREKQEADWPDILYFMMENVCEEVYGEILGCYSTAVDGLCISLLSLPESAASPSCTGEEELLQLVLQKTELISSFFREKADTILTGNVTEVGQGKASILQLYSQIQEMVRFRDWVGTKKQILVWRDLYQWQDEEEKREYQLYRNIAALLETRSYQEIQRVLSSECSLEQPENQGLPECEESAAEAEEISSESCLAKKPAPALNNSALAGRIQEYIQGHFSNPELNVNWLAEYFELSQSNLSQIFKRYYNMGPLEYIHRLRLELAKEYLAGEESIAQIAEKVGYYSTRPLIRCFKQYENMTPSEYREVQKSISK